MGQKRKRKGLSSQGGGHGPAESELEDLVYGVPLAALAVEAAGSVARAQEAIFVPDGVPVMGPVVKAVAPPSRGGENEMENAEAFWREVVQAGLEEYGAARFKAFEERALGVVKA